MMISGVITGLAAFVLGIFNLMVMALCLFLFSISLWAVSSPSTMSTAMQVAGNPTLAVLPRLDRSKSLPAIRSSVLRSAVVFDLHASRRPPCACGRTAPHLWLAQRQEIALLPPEELTVQNGVGTAALATFLFIIAFMGLYGAVTRSQYVLCMYSTLVILLLLLECALTYYLSSTLIEKGLSLERDGQWTHALRLVFRCCDVRNSTQNTLKPPWSCCGADFYPENCTLASAYEKDCHATISSWIDTYIAAVYASIAVLHLVLASCSLLLRCSRSHS